MEFFFNIIKGVFIGSGAILPGISSGVLCVIFGIYDKLLDSILNFFKDIKKNFIFLCPIFIGAFIGVILFSNILEIILYKFPLQTKSIFIGLILGGVVLLIKDINKKNRFKIRNFIYLIISLIIGIVMVFLENKMPILNCLENVNFIYLIISGFLMSAGIIIPGMSSTIILMLLGIYNVYLNSLSILYLPVLIPMGIGVIIGSLIFMKIIKFLLDNFYIETMYIIIGFTIGSIFVLFPQVNSINDNIILSISIICGYLFVTNVIKK